MTPTAAKQPQTQIRPAAEQQANLLDQALEATASRTDDIACRYAEAIAQSSLRPLQRAMLVASGIQALEKAIDGPMLDMIYRLRNTQLGFMCDRPTPKDSREYTKDEVKRCVIVGLLNGFFPFNNEMNIISGKFYGAKEGWKRKCEEIEGISDLHIAPGVPRIVEGRTVVRVNATWKIDGHRHQLMGADDKPGMVFPISTNSYSTDDNTTGKAYRKAYKVVYEYITGTKLTEDDEVLPRQAQAEMADKIQNLPPKTNGESKPLAEGEPPPNAEGYDPMPEEGFQPEQEQPPVQSSDPSPTQQLANQFGERVAKCMDINSLTNLRTEIANAKRDGLIGQEEDDRLRDVVATRETDLKKRRK